LRGDLEKAEKKKIVRTMNTVAQAAHVKLLRSDRQDVFIHFWIDLMKYRHSRKR